MRVYIVLFRDVNGVPDVLADNYYAYKTEKAAIDTWGDSILIGDMRIRELEIAE